MQSFKFVLLLILGLMLVTACGGGGSSDSAPDLKACYRAAVEGEIEISTAAQLAGIASTGKYILTGDISLTGQWTPIASFEGELDGNCYVISGLTIEGTTSLARVGLFGRIENAKISNVILEDVNIDVEINAGNVVVPVGGIAGYAKNSEIAGSHSVGVIKVSTIANRTLYTGGLVGELVGGRITDSYNEATVTTIASGNYDKGSDTGGIAGNAAGDALISNVYNTANIWAQTNTSSALGLFTVNVGGIVADAGGVGGLTISNSYNMGVIRANTNSTPARAGGIVGNNNNSSIIRTSYNAGLVAAYSENNIASAGGIAGMQYGEISDSYSRGDVSAEGETGANAGGIAGVVSNGSILNTYSRSLIEAISGSSNSNAGSIVGNSAGGITIKYSVALNIEITADNTGAIVGTGSDTNITGNIARNDINGGAPLDNSNGVAPNGFKPVEDLMTQSPYKALGWDFVNTWKMGVDFPVFQWEE